MKASSLWMKMAGRKEDNSCLDPNIAERDPFFIEQVKAMRAKFEYRVDLHKIKLVAITSSIAGEGKTLTSTYLAINLASSGRKKVLLIDVDLRKCDLVRGLNISRQPGLSEFLTGKSIALKDIIRNSNWPGLYVIPGGAKSQVPTDMLAGSKFHDFLRDIREQFDYILLDTAPILPVADTLSLRDQVDGFVFLYRANFTPYKMLMQAAEEVGEEKIIGVILNGVNPRSQKYYKKYYGRYYAKTKKEETTA